MAELRVSVSESTLIVNGPASLRGCIRAEFKVRRHGSKLITEIVCVDCRTLALKEPLASEIVSHLLIRGICGSMMASSKQEELV